MSQPPVPPYVPRRPRPQKKSGTFAATTTVSPEKSRAEIEWLLKRYGAKDFAYATSELRAMVGFRANERMVRFEMRIPPLNDARFWRPASDRERGTTYGMRDGQRGHWRSPEKAGEAWEQEVRRLWRALALVIKAKLEAVTSGITTFEVEFMGHIVLPDGQTVAAHVLPRIAEAYKTGQAIALLPALSGDVQ